MDLRFVFIIFVVLQLCECEIWITWPNTPPNSIPFEKSSDIIDWEYLNNTGNYEYGGNYKSADTWYPSWASNGNIYTPFTDGTIYFNDGTHIDVFSGKQGNATTGFATIIGNDPTNLTISKDGSGVFASFSNPYDGRYPCSNLVYNHTWFYGTYGVGYLNDDNIWYIACPFVGFRWSTNYGKTWIEPRMKMNDEYDNIFNETCYDSNSKNGYKVIKFGTPHTVDFGKNLQYSPDKNMYLIGHGSNINNSTVSWIQGDQVYLAKVKPTINDVNNSKSWMFYNGNNSWINGDVSAAKPLFEWINKTGCVTMTYFNVLKKYIITITTPTNKHNTTQSFDTYFLESDDITGPFKYITYLAAFGPQAYFVNYPSTFLDDKIIYDNITKNYYYGQYLSYSDDWYFNGTFGGNINISKPYGGGYHWGLQRSRFKLSQQFAQKIDKH